MASPAELGTPLKVLIRADASPRIGAGHALRCLNLAKVLREKGTEVSFAFATMPESLQARVREAGFRLCAFEGDKALDSDAEDWDRQILPADVQRADAETALACCPDATLVILDHYRMDSAWLGAIPQGVTRLVIDDLGNRKLDADILVDPASLRAPESYRAIVPDDCERLVGLRYAILDPSFVELRDKALARRRVLDKARTVFVSLGMMDVGGMTLRLVQDMLKAFPDLRISVALGSIAQRAMDLSALGNQEERLSVHIDATNVAALMVEADVAIGAAGTSSWERCCLGLPMIVIPVAENQREGARLLDEAGAAIIAEDADDAMAALARIKDDGDALSRLSAEAAQLIDGRGAWRVADAACSAVASARRIG